MSAQTEPCLTDPECVQNWLAQLSWPDLESSAASLSIQLTRLAKIKLAASERLELLERYHDPVLQLTTALEDRLLDCALPLANSDQETAKQLLELCRLMADNYLQVVFAPEFLDGERLNPARRQTALTRALAWLARLARHSAEVYRPPQENFWRVVYQIYCWLETHALLPLPNSEEISPLRNQLFRILLLGVCGLGRFRPREIKQIDQFLEHLAEYAEIGPQPVRENYRARFFFDISLPRPPRSVKLLRPVSPPPDSMRFLYTQKVTQKLLASISSLSEQETLPGSQAKKLALRLAHLLGAPSQRKWRRRQERRDCLLIAGFSQLIASLIREGQVDEELSRLLPAPTLFDPSAEFRADFKLLPLDAEAIQREEERFEAEVWCQLLNEQATTSEDKIWGCSFTAEGSTIQFPGRFADACAGGYCLIWLDHTCPKLKVGEILGINHTQGEIEVGAIRWLRQETAEEIAVGVELLSFTASLVVVGPWIKPTAPAYPRRRWGLLLPPQPVLNRPTCLLSPAGAWQPGQWVEIQHSLANKQTYCLKQRIDATLAYDLFSLEKID
ncbi:MAG: hypothetical protein N3A55_07245 [Methylohalobius sp.]|nr:hypothetical protein [Methylohalobius sp.]